MEEVFPRITNSKSRLSSRHMTYECLETQFYMYCASINRLLLSAYNPNIRIIGSSQRAVIMKLGRLSCLDGSLPMERHM